MGNTEEVADRISQDLKLRLSLSRILSKYDEMLKRYITAVYEDEGLRKIYDSMRLAASVSKKTSDTRRLAIKYPNLIVRRFLDDVFSPKYGSEWATNEQTLRKVMRNEELIKPWIIQPL